LKALGIDDVIGFDFMDKPARQVIFKLLDTEAIKPLFFFSQTYLRPSL
jgi:hypothetical protein